MSKSNGMDHKKVESRIDYLQYIDTDISLHIMSFLDDPLDIVRASVVSRFWRQFVIENGVAKELCFKTFPEFSNILGTVNIKDKGKRMIDLFSLETDHEVYACLLHTLSKSIICLRNIIDKGISASNNSNYPRQCIAKRLDIPNLWSIFKDSHWSSNGQSTTDVPETLTYKLRRGIWAITKFYIKHFRGEHVYSEKSVRFKMGHLKFSSEIEWSYTSPEFPMMQNERMQTFKLPQPVICIGGYLQIELLGGVKKNRKDGLYFTCVTYVRALGHCLSPAFDIEIHESYGKPLLLYYPDKLSQ